MNPALRQTISARAAAVGLIAFVFFGNFWAGYVLMHSQPPVWIVYGFVGGIAVTGLSAIGLAATIIYWKLKPEAMPIIAASPLPSDQNGLSQNPPDENMP